MILDQDRALRFRGSAPTARSTVAAISISDTPVELTPDSMSGPEIVSGTPAESYSDLGSGAHADPARTWSSFANRFATTHNDRARRMEPRRSQMPNCAPKASQNPQGGSKTSRVSWASLALVVAAGIAQSANAQFIELFDDDVPKDTADTGEVRTLGFEIFNLEAKYGEERVPPENKPVTDTPQQLCPQFCSTEWTALDEALGELDDLVEVANQRKRALKDAIDLEQKVRKPSWSIEEQEANYRRGIDEYDQLEGIRPRITAQRGTGAVAQQQSARCLERPECTGADATDSILPELADGTDSTNETRKDWLQDGSWSISPGFGVVFTDLAKKTAN